MRMQPSVGSYDVQCGTAVATPMVSDEWMLL
jgi:hypothetical protein